MSEGTQISQYPAVADTIARGRVLKTIPEPEAIPSQAEVPVPAATPWSWTSEEANQFLFSQIQNEFAFGEGEMLDWSPEEVAFNDCLFQANDVTTTNFMQ